MKPIDLAQTPVHLSTVKDKPFEVLEGFNFDGPSFERYLAQKCTENEPGCLVMEETSADSWGTWECHPVGDELVIVLEGNGTFYQELEGEIVAIPFKAGDTILNKKGVWHTADVESALRAIYITTCPDTDHKPRIDP